MKTKVIVMALVVALVALFSFISCDTTEEAAVEPPGLSDEELLIGVWSTPGIPIDVNGVIYNVRIILTISENPGITFSIEDIADTDYTDDIRYLGVKGSIVVNDEEDTIDITMTEIFIDENFAQDIFGIDTSVPPYSLFTFNVWINTGSPLWSIAKELIKSFFLTGDTADFTWPYNIQDDTLIVTITIVEDGVPEVKMIPFIKLS